MIFCALLLLLTGCAPKIYDYKQTNTDEEFALQTIDNMYKTGKKDEAKKEAIRWLSAHPTSLHAMTTLGNIYFWELDYRNAASVYQEALTIDEKNPLILNNTALCMLHQHKDKDALKYAKRAVEIDGKYKNTLLEIEQAIKENK